jgi:hypothetical protein
MGGELVAVVGDVSDTRRTGVPSTTATPQVNATDLLNQAKGMAQDLLSGTRSRAEEAYSSARAYADRATGSAEQGGSSTVPASRPTEAIAAPKSIDRTSSDHAIAPKGPGPEQSATDGVLDVSGGGQSLPSTNIEKETNGEATDKTEGVASSRMFHSA